MAKTTIAELEQRCQNLEDALLMAVGRIEKLEAAPAKPAGRPAWGSNKQYEFSGTFEAARDFAKANCTRSPGLCKTLVDGEYVHHVFFNK